MALPSVRSKLLPVRGLKASLDAVVADLLEGEICYATDEDQYYQKEGGVLVQVGATKAQGLLADSAVQPGDDISTLNNDAGYITSADIPVTSVNGQTGTVVLDKSDVGLGNVDNTSDADKPISTATQTALDSKADLVGGVVPTTQLPAVALSDFRGIVASEAAMIALSLARLGDWCYRSDIGDPYLLIAEPYSTASNWLRVTSSVAVTSVNGQTGTVVLSASDVGAATTAQGALADTAIQPSDNISELNNDVGYITEIAGNQFSSSFRYSSSTGLTPGAGFVQFNSTDYSNVTKIAFSKLDRNNNDTSEFLNDIVKAGFTVYFEQQGVATRAVQFEITGLPDDNIGNVTWDVTLISQTGLALQDNNDVITQFQSAPISPVTSVAGKTGAVTLVKGDVGLGNVDNTSDANKPISTATQSALDIKADLVGGVIPNSQLPSLAISEYLGAVPSEPFMLALFGQRGDWCIRTDTSSTWVITTDGGSNLSDWTELATPADAVTSVNGYTGTVVLGASDVGAATTAQGATADSAIQPGDSRLIPSGGTAGQVIEKVDGTDFNVQWATPTGGSGLWSSGTGGDIYYNSGSVGIGLAADPRGVLEVQDGSIYFSNSAAADEAWDLSMEAGTGDLELKGFHDGAAFDALTIRRNLGVPQSFVAINAKISNSPLDIYWTATATDRPTIRMYEFRPAIRFVDISTDALDGEIVMDGNMMRWKLGDEGSTPSQALSNQLMTLNANGDLNIAGSFIEPPSDSAYKTNIADASTSSELSDVVNLQLRTWTWDNAPGSATRNARMTKGLVAQEAELVDSNLVYTATTSERDENDDLIETSYKVVDHKVLIMKLLGAIQELEARVNALENP